MAGGKLLCGLIGAALLANPLKAQSLEVAKGDWSDIPLLARHHTVRLGDSAMQNVDTLVATGKCSAIGDRKRINLDIDILVEFTRDNSVKRIVVKDIGCPEVQQIAATAAAQAAAKGWLKPTGENEAGWYRGSITYQLR